MAKILHTADIHLQEQSDERWQALTTILDTAQELGVDALTISGDLFEQNVEAQTLRGKLPPLFSKQEYRIIILPGNHDLYSYETGFYFGDNVTLLNNSEQQIELNQTVITGIPFEPLSAAELYQKIETINQQLNPEKTNILLFHGELTDIFFKSSDFGDEGEKRYLPLKLNLLANTKFDYILAGHFHTKFHLKQIPNERLKQGGFFVYPGSPVSITNKETGVRHAALIQPQQPPQKIELDTFYYQPVPLHFSPDDDQSILKKFEKKLQNLDENAAALCRVDGFFDQKKLKLTEQQLKTKLESIIEQHDGILKEKDFAVKDIAAILNSGLYQAFTTKLKQSDLEQQQKQDLSQTFINALMQVNS